MKISRDVIAVTGLILIVMTIVCCGESKPLLERPRAVLIADFENEIAAIDWKPVGKAEASLITDPAYVKVGESSLKLTFMLDPNQWDFGLQMTNSKVTTSFAPMAIYFWVFPENTNSIMFEISDTDGTTAHWERCNLQINKWNFIRALLSHAAITKSKTQADSNVADISSMTIGLQGLAASIATPDPALPFAYYIGGVSATNSNLILENSSPSAVVAGENTRDLKMESSFWQGAETSGGFSPRSMREGPMEFVFSIMQNNKNIYQSVQNINLYQGNNDIRFYLNSSRQYKKTPIWEVQYLDDDSAFCLAEGDYQLEISWDGNSLRRSFTVLGKYGVEEKRRQLSDRMAMLAKLVDDRKKNNEETAYAELALALAKRYIQKESDASLSLRDFSRAGTDLEKCRIFVDKAIIDSQKGKEPKVPIFDMRNIHLKSDNFYVDENPVMLVGPLGWRALWGWITEVPKFGFNIIDDASAGQVSDFSRMMAPGTWGNPETFFHAEKASSVLNTWDRLAAENLNLAVAFNPNVQSEVPGWLYFVYPETKPDGTWGGGFVYFPIESMAVRHILEKYYAGIVPVVKDHPNLLFYWLHCESAYWSRNPSYLKLFCKHLTNRYGSIDKLNTVWQTTYKDFAEVGFPDASNRAAWYDWQNFNYAQLTDLFKFQNDQVKKWDPQAITSNKPIAYEMVLNNAVDCEAQAEIYDMPGCDSYTDYYYLNPVNILLNRGIMLYDFFKSVSPNKPISNTEMHFTDESWRLESEVGQDEIVQFAQSVLWQSYLHGLRACTYWGWHWTPFSQPSLTYGIGKSALDLRRTAKYVSKFPPKPQVVIYYSNPSLYMDRGPYVDALTRTYVGMFFLDTPIGFATDKMLLKGLGTDVKLLVIPMAKYVTDDIYAAIETYAKNGRKLIVIGSDSLAYSETNQPRNVEKLKMIENVSFWQDHQSAKSYAQKFDKVISVCGIIRPIRITNDAGAAVWQIESRTVENNGVKLTYLINLNREEKALFLKKHDGTPIIYARDVINEEVITFPIIMKPLDVKLLIVE